MPNDDTDFIELEELSQGSILPRSTVSRKIMQSGCWFSFPHPVSIWPCGSIALTVPLVAKALPVPNSTQSGTCEDPNESTFRDWFDISEKNGSREGRVSGDSLILGYSSYLTRANTRQHCEARHTGEQKQGKNGNILEFIIKLNQQALTWQNIV